VSGTRRHSRWLSLLGAAAVTALCVTSPGHAQGGPTITPNYKDADIRQIIEAVSEVTGQNFIVDPRVKADVTMLSSTPMSPEAFYEAFLSILEVNGYVAVPSGDVTKIMPDANARQMAGAGLTDAAGRPRDEFVTQVVKIKNVAAAQLVPVLRPLVVQAGHLAAYPPSNVLIISDRAANVSRILRIINRIDQAGDDEIEVIPLENASASEVVRTITSLNQATGRTGEGGSPLGLVADERTNSLLISGDMDARLRLRALVTHLDTPLDEGGNTQVIYLRYADAEELSASLKEQATQQIQSQGGQAGGAPAAGGGGGGANRLRPEDVIIWADAATNALIITAPPEIMRTLRQVIAKLDIRRAQVLVEAIIAEVAYDKAAELGVSWVIDGSDDGNIVGITNFSSALNVRDVAPGAAALASNDSDGEAGLGQALAAIPNGMSLAGGRFGDSGTNWAVIVRALLGDATTNVLSTPSIVTMDNEEAEIKVGQQVPFLTGQFTNTGAAQGSVNPFQTIQREDVGLTLKITPQINEGNAVVLDVDLEQSSLSGQIASALAVDLVTNQRSITQKVIIEDGDILVLGGLVGDELIEIDEKVPLLGDIPLLGSLFRSQSAQTTKRTLMVFLRPVILEDGVQAGIETNAKYRLMRDVLLEQGEDRTGILKNIERPGIPAFEENLPASEGYEAPEPAEELEVEGREMEPSTGTDGL
jgi:general secretion pathway protein D